MPELKNEEIDKMRKNLGIFARAI